MKNICIYLALFIFGILFCACQKGQQNLLYDRTFDQMKDLAQKKNKPFCIIISNTGCPPCSNLLEKLESKYKNLLGKAIFNVVDASLPENQWYQQWISAVAMPTTCVFSPEGKLQAIVPGAAERCLNCLESSLEGNTACAGYLYSMRYKVSGNVIQALNTILECKLKLDKGEYIGTEIAESFSQIQYPYNIYLKYISEQQQGNREEAAYWASLFLQFNDAYSYMLYGEILSQVKNIINPDYNPAQDAVLQVDKKLTLDGCVLKQPKPFSITVANTGINTLEIKDIGVSCSCVKLLGEKKQSIDSGKSKVIEFEFTADAEGELYREITFFSNARNALETVEIKAIVK